MTGREGIMVCMGAEQQFCPHPSLPIWKFLVQWIWEKHGCLCNRSTKSRLVSMRVTTFWSQIRIANQSLVLW